MRQGRVMPETAVGGMGVTFWEEPTDKECWRGDPEAQL